MLKKISTKEKLFSLIFVLIALHPFYELDYLFAKVLPFRFTTLVNFVVYPLLVFGIFLLCEKNKKRVIIFSSIYLILLIAYFIPHCLTGFYLQDNIHLTNLYYFTVYDEVFYIATLLIPLCFVYAYEFCDLKETILRNITMCISLFVSLPIVVSNLFMVGRTTYETDMAGNIIDWFSLPFDATAHHPRNYATKFFFKEGNTIGILMTMVLPLMYYFFLKEKNKKKKTIIGILIVFDSLTMMILGTRVAAYCALLIPPTVLIIHIFTRIIKTGTFNKWFAGFCVVLTLMNAGIIPYCPAYQNQQFDAADFSTLKMDDSIREGYRRSEERR